MGRAVRGYGRGVHLPLAPDTEHVFGKSFGPAIRRHPDVLSDPARGPHPDERVPPTDDSRHRVQLPHGQLGLPRGAPEHLRRAVVDLGHAEVGIGHAEVGLGKALVRIGNSEVGLGHARSWP